MAEPAGAPRWTTFATVLAVLAALYFAQDVLMPVSLAALLSFSLAPLVVRLQSFLGRIAAVLVVVVVACGAVGGVTYLVAGQLTELAHMVPQYRENITAKLGSLRFGVFEQATRAVKEIERDVQAQHAQEKRAESDPERATKEPAPVKVELVEPEPSSIELLASAFGPLLGPLGTGGMVVVLVIFMLLARQDLRDRIVRLMGRGRIRVTTQAMDEAAHRVSRYLFMQTVINAVHGLAVAVGMFALGVPGFLLWGLLSMVLRFVPYVGPWIAASLPVLVALAVFDGWSWPLLVVGYFVVIELLSNNVLEPWLYGSSAGVSPLAVIVTAIFWTWLWGPVGLLLSTPITVCMVVMGKHVPQLQFMHVLFGDEPVLEPPARFYQRLVAMNQEEASEVAEAFLAERGSLVAVFDELVLPALAMTEMDRHEGDVDETRSRYIHGALREILVDLSELAEHRAAADVLEVAARQNGAVGLPEAAGTTPLPALPPAFTVLVLPAHDEADELAGEMLALLVRACGGRATAISVTARTAGLVDVVQQNEADVVFVSAVPPSAVAHARHVQKRLRARFPHIAAVVGLWTQTGPLDDARTRIDAGARTSVVTTMRTALVELERRSRSTTAAAQAPPA